MPNLILTSNAKFRPFEYSEMLAPVLMATQAHQAVEEAYSELDSQANAIGSLANKTSDPVTYARYKSYEASLRNQADILAKNGLTPGSRKSLLDLKGRYAKEITPIQNAITRRRELADEQRKALLQNPTLMFQRDMNSVSYDSSLDRFLENPDYDYGQQYSGALLTQQVSQAAGNLAKELTNYGNGKRLDAYTKTFLQQHGFTREQVLDAITNPDRAKSQPVLNAIVEQVVGSSGMANWADNPTMTKAYNYARQGLWSAIGQTNVSPYADYGARAALTDYYRRKAAGEQQLKGLAINPTPMYSRRDRTQAERDFQNNLKNYSKYFYKDSQGRTRLTEAGLKEYRRNAAPRVTVSGSGSGTARLMNAETQLQNPQTKFTPTEFKQFLDSIGGSMRMEEGAGWNSARIGSLWDKYMENPVAATAGYDATKYTKYSYTIDPSENQVWKNQILRTALNGELHEVDFKGKDGRYVDTGETISVEDLNSDKYTVINIDMSRYGNTVSIKDDKGKVRDFRLPAGINDRNEQAIQKYLDYANQLEQIPNGGWITGIDGEPVYVTKEQVDEEYANTLMSAQSHLSQLGLTNKTKEQEFNAYSW